MIFYLKHPHEFLEWKLIEESTTFPDLDCPMLFGGNQIFLIEIVQDDAEVLIAWLLREGGGREGGHTWALDWARVRTRENWRLEGSAPPLYPCKNRLATHTKRNFPFSLCSLFFVQNFFVRYRNFLFGTEFFCSVQKIFCTHFFFCYTNFFLWQNFFMWTFFVTYFFLVDAVWTGLCVGRTQFFLWPNMRLKSWRTVWSFFSLCEPKYFFRKECRV